MSISRWMDKEDVVHIHNVILFSHKNKTNCTICNNMHGGRGHYAQWNKPGRERQVPNDFTHMCSPHHLIELLTYRGFQTLPPCRILTLQTSLIEDPSLTFATFPPHNLANLLSAQHPSPYTPHSCTQHLSEWVPHPAHLQEGALPQAHYTWFTDGSSFIHNHTRIAGYAVVSLTEVTEAQTLPSNTTNQQAELIAITRAFTPASNSSLTIYTDSKYAFHILLFHAAIWKGRGLLTTKGTSITNHPHITTLLKASQLPKAIGLVHCKAHQTDQSTISG